MCWSKALGSYLHSRFPANRFAPLAVFIAAAGLASSPPAQLWEWILAAAMALPLILQFRLWDDIADREHDRETHPGRVLSHTRDLKPFLVTAVALFVMNGFLLQGIHVQNHTLTGYLLLCACLLAWYWLRPHALHASLLNSHLVLLKYPVIAWLVGVPAADTHVALLLSCLLSVYLIFIIFEILDDDSLQELPGAIFSLGASLALLVCVWICIVLQSRPHTGPLPWAVWSGIVTGTLILGLSGISTLKHRTVSRNRRGFFIVGLLAYLAVAVEKSI